MRNKNIPILIAVAILALVVLYGYVKKDFGPPKNSIPANDLQPSSKTNPLDWKEAEEKWRVFAEQHIEKMRQLDREPRKFVEVKSELISKYLPNFRIYTEKYFTFALRVDGDIIEIAKPALGWQAKWVGPGEEDYESYYRSPEYSDFMSKQRIQVADSQTAIEVIKLTEDIYNRSGYEPSWWEYTASKSRNIWTIRIEWVGPSTYSIILPPVWEIVVDEQSNLKEIRQQRERF
ncbi:MAG: hypothetical protein AAB738_02925 [Patescibacteria group bacterium]